MAEKSERAQREEKILQFWKDNKIFEKSLEKNSPKGEFVFYDGPPFATGLPHYGSLLSSIIKDVIPRYKTMRGFRVRRRWGWDCHGLPIENMVEKELGIKSKKEIEAMGVAKFNRACRDSVLRFADEWKVFIDRIGRFVDYDHSYKTMDNSYIESVWWALKEIHNKGLLYEGRKVLLYCPHCETPLAKAEIAMDQSYKDVTEEAVTVKFKIVGEENTYLLTWTTTPWTLPGNVALAVGEKIDYVKIKIGAEIFVLAESRLSVINTEYEITRKLKGKDLVGLEYEPLYEVSAVKESKKKVWYVASGNFVNTEEGTGIVHTAVLYGEDDYELGLRLDLPMVPLLDSAGHFNNNTPEFIKGQYFKKAEKAIKEDLEKRNLLFERKLYTHSYPHCHRCDTALLYNALSSWFINIQKKKGRMIELNEKINWIPNHLKHGRFLNNVGNAPDWTISRNRYWASPLPIWKDSEGKVSVIGSLDELKKRTKKSGNKYFVMRHGEADHNVKNILDLTGDPNVHLTKKGREQIKKAKLKNINMVFSSPFLRSRESAEIISKDFMQDGRLREMHPEESVPSMRQRMFEFIFDIENKYRDKNILILSHQGPLNALAGTLLDTGEVSEFEFVPFPHNENFELDLHRPYIDEVALISENGKALKRIPEVIDGWVESGSMPFAEYHYPFENKEEFKKHFP
ncbi:MAG: class I tRNA ligase family protein, partial [bacterium]|nr:class I tRNA ligase family protein [bacterium]